MLLIHIAKQTNRLDYILKFIFKDILQMDFRITVRADEFISHKDAKLSYGEDPLCDELFIKSTSLLFSDGIAAQNLQPASESEEFYIFPTYSNASCFQFDMFAASFYLVARYEEYLPNIHDIHQRYHFENSLLHQYKCLKKPLIDIWALRLKKLLKQKYPELVIPERQFQFIPTFDIDNAYAYKHRGFPITVLKLASALANGRLNIALRQIKVLLGVSKDPFDTYDFLIESFRKYNLKAIIFILFADHYKGCDKNISSRNRKFRKLIKYLEKHAVIGIHPSYASFLNPQIFQKEIQDLEVVLEKPVQYNRFHFIRFKLPDSYDKLIQNNILHDYSMGYPSENGFRAGTCTPFYYYDLINDCETELQVHPFAMMDATLHYYMKLSPQSAFFAFKEMIDEVKSVNGTFYCIWHNESLCEYFSWKGWKEVYEQVMEYGTKS